MQEGQVGPAPQTQANLKQEEKKLVTPVPENGSPKINPKLLAIGGAILVLIIIGGGMFFLGRRGGQAEVSPTPSETPTPTPEEGEEEAVETPSPSPTETPSPSPSPTPTPEIKTKTISATASLDGWRASNGGGNNSWYIQVGRNNTLIERGFVSFDLSSLPDGATITKASLRLYQTEVVGDPYGAGGNLRVDHLNYGDSLDGSDYDTASISHSFTTLTNNAVYEWKDADVTDRIKDDIANGRSRSQYRLRFAVEATGADAWARFESADNYVGTGKTPQLVVKYQ